MAEFSPVFEAMLASGLKEAKENKMIISKEEFPHKVVKYAIELCYKNDVQNKLTLSELLLLYQFAEKYEIKPIMASFTYLY